MKLWNQLDSLDLLQLDIKSILNQNKKTNYLNIASGFDIETSSFYNNDKKVSLMYVWAWGIADTDHIYYGRTWEEFKSLLEIVVTTLEINKDNRLIVYVHNLGYEFQFMQHYFTWEKIFAVGNKEPIKALTTDGIEFRDSYILSGYSLAKTADNLVNHEVKKLVGDLDYRLLRTKETRLSDKELGYLQNDVDIILAYISEQIELYGDITRVPLTNTGRVRKYVKELCYDRNSIGKYNRYKALMEKCTLTVDSYKQLKRAFQGGFTHANAMYSGKLLENVASYDFTSSYPSVMITEKYPMSSPIDVTVKSLAELKGYMKNYCVMFDVMFIDIESKISQENYISESKCFILDDGIINNGRVYKAKKLATTITDVDFKIIQQVYRYKKIAVKNVRIFEKGYLPKVIVQAVLELYQDKTMLKGVDGKQAEYQNSKAMINSTYGMMVTDITKDNYVYENGEWEQEVVDMKETINQYNHSHNRFLYYPWGVWVTAYARANLWSGIISLGDDYVYSDTDSVKFLNHEKHLSYINKYNTMVKKKQEVIIKYYRLDENLFKPKTIQGVEMHIGLWDYEGTASRFKTLGAKRYLSYVDNEYKMTVAGLHKTKGVEFLELESERSGIDVFDLFTKDLYVPNEYSGRYVADYINEPIDMTVTDYQGNTSREKIKSGLHLESTSFTMSILAQYVDFINNMKQGKILIGVDN